MEILFHAKAILLSWQKSNDTNSTEIKDKDTNSPLTELWPVLGLPLTEMLPALALSVNAFLKVKYTKVNTLFVTLHKCAHIYIYMRTCEQRKVLPQRTTFLSNLISKTKIKNLSTIGDLFAAKADNNQYSMPNHSVSALSSIAMFKSTRLFVSSLRLYVDSEVSFKLYEVSFKL